MTRQLDKMIAIPMPGADWALEGIFARGGGDAPEGGAVIAPPHPLYGGSMESPVVSELAWACHRGGLATVRFNWRGVGASGGEASGERDAAEADYAAALAHLEETVSGPLIAAGYSFGAATALRCALASPAVDRLLLVAPPPGMIGTQGLERFRGRVLVIVGSRDDFAPLGDVREGLAGCERSHLEVIESADHFFGTGLAEIGRRAYDWLGDA